MQCFIPHQQFIATPMTTVIRYLIDEGTTPVSFQLVAATNSRYFFTKFLQHQCYRYLFDYVAVARNVRLSECMMLQSST